MKKGNNEPYEALGAKIKHFRKHWHQSISEVSGTLEVDESVLREIESGKVLPSEELLNMLINHFLLTEEQADELRQMASLPQEHAPESLLNGLEEMIMKKIVMYMPADNRVAYTDSMNATVNKHGVTLQFMQQSGQNNQSVPVSQVGMSREHAEKVIEVLSRTLREYDSNQKQKLISDKSNDSK
jgi:DNA-binding XRE family transcriptional regulator